MSIFVPQVEPYISDMCFLPKPLVELGRDPWSKNIDVIFGGTANEGFMIYFFTPIDKQLEVIKQDSSFLLLPEMRKGLTTEAAQAKGNALKQLYFKTEDAMSCYIDVSILSFLSFKIPNNYNL